MAKANGSSPATAVSHSPPPWQVRRNGDTPLYIAAKKEHGFICVADIWGTEEQSEIDTEAKANARLIAEAPAMLAELENLVRVYASLETSDGINGGDLVEALEEWVLPGVERVIAKAKGEAA